MIGNELHIRILISVLSLALAIFAMFAPNLVSNSVLILFALAILPWSAFFLRSFEFGAGGFKAELLAFEHKIEKFAEATEAVVETQVEPDEDGDDLSLADGSVVLANEQQIEVLNALIHGNYRLRTAAGIAKEIGRARTDVDSNLSAMHTDGWVNLVERSLLSKARGKSRPLWGITAAGRRALKNAPTR